MPPPKNTPFIMLDCPQCKTELRASPDQVGSGIDCPKCGTVAIVPEPSIPKNPADPNISSPQKIKCPNCGGEPMAEAILCIHCGTNLKTGQQIQLNNQESITQRTSGKGIVKWAVIIVVLTIILGGGGFGYRQYRYQLQQQKEDDQLYEYTKTKVTSATTIKERVDFFASYIQKYPSGRHAGEIKALAEQEQEKLVKLNNRTPEEKTKDTIKTVVDKLLTAWRDGKYAGFYTTRSFDGQLISPTEWQIRQVMKEGSVVAFVKSSNRGGMPIQGLWRFWLIVKMVIGKCFFWGRQNKYLASCTYSRKVLEVGLVSDLPSQAQVSSSQGIVK